MNGTIFMGPDGQLYRRTNDGRLFRLDRFAYVVNAIVNPAAGAPPVALNNVTLNTDGDYDFELHEIVGNSTSPLLTVAMVDTADAGKRFQSAAVNFANWAGTAQLPFVLIPQFWPRRKNLSLDFVDLSGAINTVQIVFHGYKLVPITNVAAPKAA